MGSHSGVRTKIALLGSNRWSNRPIAGMSDIFVYYASLRLSLSKTNSTMHAQYPQLHSPERAPRESKICSREAFPAETPHCRRPNPVLYVPTHTLRLSVRPLLQSSADVDKITAVVCAQIHLEHTLRTNPPQRAPTLCVLSTRRPAILNRCSRSCPC